MELIDQVKRKLDITWSDEDTDKRVKDIMNSVSPVLRHRLGITDPRFDFAKPGFENMLFLSACLYERDHVLNEFWDNYADDIAQCRAIHAVAYHSMKESEGGCSGATS